MTETADRNPAALPGLAPHLVIDGSADAIEFYKKAFNAVEMMRLSGENGRLMHASVNINGCLVDENPAYNIIGPKTLEGSPVTLHLMVSDVDKSYEQALAAGAKSIMAPMDMFWGDRYGALEDPVGHKWSMATPKKNPSHEEIEKASKAAMPDYVKKD
jgi:uncharacterized glyoxalase superfamily protein PhnB